MIPPLLYYLRSVFMAEDGNSLGFILFSVSDGLWRSAKTMEKEQTKKEVEKADGKEKITTISTAPVCEKT